MCTKKTLNQYTLIIVNVMIDFSRQTGQFSYCLDYHSFVTLFHHLILTLNENRSIETILCLSNGKSKLLTI